MPENLTPQNQWETEFQVPLPGEPRNIGPLKTIFQRLLNRTERLKGRIADILGVAWDATPPATISALNTRLANVEANQGSIPDGSVTTTKLADGAVTAAKLAPGATPYDLALYVAGAVQANATLLRLVAPRSITLPTSGHQVRCAVAPAANWTATINKNGGSVGTISISAGQTTGSISIASAVSLTAGDTLTIVAPSTADSSLRGLSVVLQGVT